MALAVILAIGAMITFVFLNQKFEGPDALSAVSDPYELTARFENSKTLPSKQPVLHKGVSVGRIRSVDWDAEAKEAVVTFTVDDEIQPLYRDAKLQIGERSLLGDAYLNLVDRGSEAAGELESGAEVVETLRSVNFDEALDFLDEEGRARVRSLIDTVAEGTARQGNGERLNGTLGGLAGVISELRLLTDALKGQEEQIATLTSDAATVFSVLGEREQAIRTITAAGRQTLDALASNTDSLGQAIDELPPLLDTGRSTLAEVRPLLSKAAPLVADLRELAPDLEPAFKEGAPFAIGPISSDLVEIIEGLRPQRIASEEILPQIVELNEVAAPVVAGAGPAALNAQPIANYLAPRADSIGAFYALGASAVAHGDEVGRYTRFALIPTPNDAPQNAYVPGGCGPTLCFNAYPEPLDSLDPQPFSGAYPQLEPFEPPSRRSVLRK